MNKCNICEHCSFTDNGEKVCTKYLVYLGNGPYAYCDGPESRMPIMSMLKLVVIAGIIAAILLYIIFSQL